MPQQFVFTVGKVHDLKAAAQLKWSADRTHSERALPVQIVSAFVTDLLLRAFKASSGFSGSLYEARDAVPGSEPDAARVNWQPGARCGEGAQAILKLLLSET